MTYYKRRTPSDQDVFDKLQAFVPKDTMRILRLKSIATGVPISRLVAISVDNEMDCETPFNYPCEMPTDPFVPYMYADQAGRMSRFLARCPGGASAQTLMLCRRMYEVPDRKEVMHAMRELIEMGIVEWFVPAKSSYNNGNEQQRLRVVGMNREEVSKKKFKRFEGESNRGKHGVGDEDIER